MSLNENLTSEQWYLRLQVEKKYFQQRRKQQRYLVERKIGKNKKYSQKKNNSTYKYKEKEKTVRKKSIYKIIFILGLLFLYSLWKGIFKAKLV